MNESLCGLLFLLGMVWTISGLFMGFGYFYDVEIPINEGYRANRPFVPCDWLFVFLFGPINWLFAVICVFMHLTKNMSFTWLDPSTWSEWVGEHCSFKKKG